jgi:voltage-gated sodium channel
MASRKKYATPFDNTSTAKDSFEIGLGVAVTDEALSGAALGEVPRTQGLAGYSLGKMYLAVDPSWPKLRRTAAEIVSDVMFEAAISIVLLIQSVMVICETNIRASVHEEAIPIEFSVFSWVCLVIYFIEIGLRMYAFRMHLSADFWLLFEFILVFVDMMCKVFAFALGRIPSVSALRILRVLHRGCMVRVLGKHYVFRELYTMLHSVASVLRTIWWAILLLVFMLTLYSVLAVEILHPINQELAASGIYEDCERCPKSFATVQASVVTFIQHTLAGEDWGSVAIPIMETRPWTAIIFLSVIISTNLGILCLFITVTVDRAVQVRQDDKRFMLEQRKHQFESAKEALSKQCLELDKECKGRLSKDQLLHGFNSQSKMGEAMRKMEVKHDDIHLLCSVLDGPGNGSIPYSEFVEQLHDMKLHDSKILAVSFKKCAIDLQSHIDEQLKLTKDLIVQRIAALSQASPHVIDVLNGGSPRSSGGAPVFEQTSAGTCAGAVGQVDECSAGQQSCFPKLLQGRLAEARTQDLLQLRQQLSADLAAASCSTVDAAIGQLLDLGSSRSSWQGLHSNRSKGSTWWPGEGRERLDLRLSLPCEVSGSDLQAYRQRSPATVAAEQSDQRVDSCTSGIACCSARREGRPQVITSHHW